MKKMTNPTKIVLHCTATKPDQKVTLKQIRRWHVEGNGWSDIGYHFVVGANGELWGGRSLNFQGAHTKGHNNSIGIAYVGGLNISGRPEDTLTEKQQRVIEGLINNLRARYGDLALHGHCEFSSKACPSFDVLEKFGHEFCLRDDESTPDVDESEAEVTDGPVQPLEELLDEEPAPKKTKKRKASNKPEGYESR